MNTTQPLVLIIEDDADLGKLYVKMVQIEQGIAELCADGLQALARLEKDPVPDLLVIDLHLPGANGEEILRAARANPRFAQTIMIVVTVDPEWAKRLGAQGFAHAVLLKPVEFPIYSRYINLARKRVSQKHQEIS
jgi:CheY-like chemotaxis protein